MAMKLFVNRVRCDQLRRGCHVTVLYQHQQRQQQQVMVQQSIRCFASKRLLTKIEHGQNTNAAGAIANDQTNSDDGFYWPRKIFSGIQPTGDLHLGNYLGAVRKWTKLQEAREDVTLCIVDMHSITVQQEPAILREHIFKMAATMLACGIDPNQSTLFVQSSVKEHSELCWLLGTLTTMARLGHLPQYKEKTRQMKEIPLGLFVYPVLQAADILLYKTTHVPVGEDQVQHIQLTQHLAKTFNSRFGRTFPICHAIIDNKQVSRIRSLRDPTKKMSKSDPDKKSAIYVNDEPEWIVEKVKKSVTDFCSDVSYEPETRLGVSNLVAIHSHMSGQPIGKIIDEARTMDTGKYKLRVADAIIEHLKPIREKISVLIEERNELITLLDGGAEKARHIACETIEEVKQRMGLGAPYLPLFIDLKAQHRASGGGGSFSGSSNSGSGTVSGSSSNNDNGGIDIDPIPMPRQNMSAVAKAAAAMNAATGGQHYKNQVPKMNTMMMGFGRPSLTMAFKQVQSVTGQRPMPSMSSSVDNGVIELPLAPPPKTQPRPIVPQQKVRIEKTTPTARASANYTIKFGHGSSHGSGAGTTSKPAAIHNITENLLSLSLLQKPKTPVPTQPPSPLQALLPQYQQQQQQDVEGPPSTAIITTVTDDKALERKRCEANTMATPPLAPNSSTSALTVTQPSTTCVELLPLKTKKFGGAATATTTDPPTKATPATSNTNAVDTKNAELLAALRACNAIYKTTITTANFQKQHSQLTANTRKMAIFAGSTVATSQPTTTPANSYSPHKSYSSTSSSTPLPASSFSSSTKSSPTEKPKPPRAQFLVKLFFYSCLAIGAGFSGVYYFWRRVLQTYFDAKKNRGD